MQCYSAFKLDYFRRLGAVQLDDSSVRHTTVQLIDLTSIQISVLLTTGNYDVIGKSVSNNDNLETASSLPIEQSAI